MKQGVGYLWKQPDKPTGRRPTTSLFLFDKSDFCVSFVCVCVLGLNGIKSLKVRGGGEKVLTSEEFRSHFKAKSSKMGLREGLISVV